MYYKLYIDDIRNPPDKSWIIARSSQEAIELVQTLGIPSEISFDHDLGGDDTSIVFLRWLIEFDYYADFEYQIHSANPIGSLNIKSIMESWIKSKVND